MADYTTIDNPKKHFNTVLYTGNGGSSLAVTGVGFQPDWVWLKSRSDTEQHTVWDSVRGGSKRLMPDDTSVEYDNSTQGLQSFDSDGFTCGDSDQYNKSSQNVASWNWKASGSTTSNSDGSITSTVSVNQTAGFSIVSYTSGQSSAFSFGHGLSSAPKMVIAKSRDSSNNWGFYYTVNGTNTNFMTLDTSDAQGTNNADPDANGVAAGGGGYTGAYAVLNSSSISIAQTAYANNGTSAIAYCFTEKQGYSKFGSYKGNGSSDGAFVYTGFKPAMVICKASSTSGDWKIFDNKRIGYNAANYRLYPNANTAETSDSLIDILSNGFKLTTSSDSINGSGNTVIYMAFAENPFVTAGTKAAGTAR